MATFSDGRPLMPKATAMWLIENTGLTFEQIADSCGLYILEVQALADGESSAGIKSENPLLSGQLTQEEIDRCTQNPEARLCFQPTEDYFQDKKKRTLKSGHYTPRASRSDRPDGIAWILKHYPQATDYQISKLLRTTSKTIQAIREKTHPNAGNIKPRNPAFLNLCSEQELNHLVEKWKKSSPSD